MIIHSLRKGEENQVNKINKVVYIPSFFKPITKKVKKNVATGEKKKGVFGGEKDVTKEITAFEQVGVSSVHIDGNRLSKDIDVATQKLNTDGYEVISIMPVTSGNYDFDWKVNINGGYGYGYGYSYTDSVIIIGKRID